MLRLLLITLVLLCAREGRAQTVEVAPGIYVLSATPGNPEPDNLGRTGNCGFIVGPTGVVVVDTGVSLAHGQALLNEIRRVTPLPVVLVINTHPVQEFLFGNAAFEGAPLLAHRESVALMRSRCEHCLENLREILGAEAMQGTRLVLPDRAVDGDTELDAGGRRLRLIHPGWAATPGDLLVLDVATGTMFAGSVVSDGQIPLLRDGRLTGWIAALDHIAGLGPARVVPGHGPAVSASGLLATRAYLSGLDHEVRRLYDAGVSLMEALDQAELPAFAHWAGYDTIHRKNVQQVYLDLEVEDLQR